MLAWVLALIAASLIVGTWLSISIVFYWSESE